MILSGAVHLDPAAHAAATRSMADRLADLDRRRRAADATVEGLLATWHGAAASAFHAQWQAWSRAATSVGDDLATGIAALDATRADLAAADDSSGVGSIRLSGRLG